MKNQNIQNNDISINVDGTDVKIPLRELTIAMMETPIVNIVLSIEQLKNKEKNK